MQPPDNGPPPARWVVPQRIGEGEQKQLGADSLLLAQLLWNRGLRTAGEAAVFLDPSGAAELANPWSMGGVPEATHRLLRARSESEQVAIYGDYDVDGVAGAALLMHALRYLGLNVTAHLPNRSRDGYGVNAEAVRRLAASGAKVIVTVDCGITANREVELAASLGMDVVVTDHHAVPARLPSAVAVLNPHQGGCGYPFKQLAGGGVALQLARALLLAGRGEDQARQHWAELAALAALSTVADVVPLTGENRMIVAQGLAATRSGALPGLRALCDSAGRPLARLTARDLAFSVIPRLNAAGRMGDAWDALDLLLSPDVDSALPIAARLESANGARRKQVEEILSAVEPEANRLARTGAVILDGDYPIGVAGLIAGRLAERCGVPCVIIERSETVSRGSIRGVEGLPLIQALEQCRSSLIQFGGHERAAGFTIRSEHLGEFRSSFQAAVRSMRPEFVPERTILADAQIRLASVSHRLAVLVERFEPVGAGNPPPTFISRGLTVRSAEQLPSGPVRLRVAQDRAVRHAVAFSPAFPPPPPGSRVDLLYEVERTVWNGDERVAMIVRDVRPVEARAV